MSSGKNISVETSKGCGNAHTFPAPAGPITKTPNLLMAQSIKGRACTGNTEGSKKYD